jgi:YD repeat-containing protein
MGNLAQVTDHATRTTLYEYDLLGRQIAVIDPLSGTTRTGYDALGVRPVYPKSKEGG